MKARSKKTILKNKITKEKKDMNKNKKAQVSIEMIIILSVLILGAVILASLLLGFFNKSVDTNVDIDAQTGNTVNNFINDLVNYNDSNNDDTPTPTPLFYNLTLTPNNPSFGSAQTSGSYQAGSPVTVIASPNAGYSFNNWTVTSTSVVASSSSSYSFNMPSNDLALTANFSLTPPTNCTLSLSRNPHFGGTTTGQGTYVCNSSVTATATPVTNYQFVNWTTPTGTVTTNPYTFNLTSNQVFTANFSPSAYTLNLTKAGSGNGTVTSNPPGISCTSSCTSDSHTFNVNQSVTLTATANAGSSFSGWSGAGCSGTGACTVTMDAAKTVTANFNPTVVFCPSSLEYNGYNYKLIQIGNQCWFAENLRTTKYSDGSNISTGLNLELWQKATYGAYEIYDYTDTYASGINSSAEMINAYGLLYNWYTLKDTRGLCPVGYRVSTDYDFEVLKNYVNNYTSDNQPGRYLKSDRTAVGTPAACTPTNTHPRFLYELSSGQCGLNTFGFSAIPAGYIKPDKSSTLLSDASYFWIDGHFNDKYAHHYSTTYYRTDFTNWGFSEKIYGMSVRCVKDNLISPVVLNYTLDVTRNNVSLGSVTGQGTVQGGSNVTVTATPNSGASFLYWSDSQNEVVSTSQNYTFKMPYSYFSLKANFNSTAHPITINLYNPTSNQQFPPYYTHPTDGTGINLMASISGSSASNSEFYKRWQVSRNNLSWHGFNSTNSGNSSSAYALYIPTQTGTYYFRLKYTDDNYPGSEFYSNVVQVNVVSLP